MGKRNIVELSSLENPSLNIRVPEDPSVVYTYEERECHICGPAMYPPDYACPPGHYRVNKDAPLEVCGACKGTSIVKVKTKNKKKKTDAC